MDVGPARKGWFQRARRQTPCVPRRHRLRGVSTGAGVEKRSRVSVRTLECTGGERVPWFTRLRPSSQEGDWTSDISTVSRRKSAARE